MHKDLKQLVHKVALEEGLSDNVVKEIVESPFAFMRNEIPLMEEDEEFKNFRIINLGLFYTTKYIIKEVKKNANKQ